MTWEDPIHKIGPMTEQQMTQKMTELEKTLVERGLVPFGDTWVYPAPVKQETSWQAVAILAIVAFLILSVGVLVTRPWV